jgi:hypothetical protein
MAYPLGARSRFDAKSQNTEKIKTRPNLESFLVNASAGLVSVSETPAASTTAAGPRHLGYVD